MLKYTKYFLIQLYNYLNMGLLVLIFFLAKLFRIKSRKKSSEKSSLPSTSSAVTKSKTRKTSKEISSKNLERKQKPSHSSQNLLSTANPSKRKNIVEISKTTNAKKSKTSSSLKRRDFVAGQNGLDSDSSVSESSSSTESLSEYTGKGKSIVGSSKTNAEQRKTVTRGTAKDLVGGKNSMESDSSSSESSSSTESSSEYNSKGKSIVGSSKTNTEQRKTVTRGTAKDLVGGKNAMESDSSSSESSSSTDSDESGPSTKSYAKSSAVVNGVKTSAPKVSKHQPNCNKSQFQKGSGKDVQKKCSSTFAAPKEKKGRGVDGGAQKSSTVTQGKKKGKCAAAAKALYSSSSDSSDVDESKPENAVMKGTRKKHLSSSSSSSSSSSLSSTTADEVVNPKTGNTNKKTSEDATRSDTTADEVVNPKTGNTNKKTSEDATRSDTKKKKMSSSSTSSLLTTSLSSSSSSTIENKEETKTLGVHQRILPLLSSSKSTGEKNVQHRTTRQDNGKPGLKYTTYIFLK